MPMSVKPPTQLAMILLLQKDVGQIGTDLLEMKQDFRAHMNNLTTQFVPSHELALITLRFAELQAAISGLTKVFERFQSTAVTQDQFWPVKMLVYGVLGIIGTGVIGIALKLQGGP